MSRVITFYSYKGGTGRSMALANVAWILASAGQRVLAIDWDLEAPGLHRYFQPFLTDKELGGQESQGVIDMAVDFAVRAATPVKNGSRIDDKWYEAYADFSKWRQKLRWPSGAAVRLGKDGRGEIDFVPAGRQGVDYARRVNHFDWHSFYEKLGGGAFFDEAKRKFSTYDYVLIDSRTGVSDTSGICTVHMPDTLVVCFTLNYQSIKGALAVAQSVREQRPKMRIFPLPTRIDGSEEKLLNRMKNYAASVFSPFLDSNIDGREYWYSMEVPYFARYAYAEKLALFEEQASISASTLPAMERLSAYLTNGLVPSAGPLLENERVLALAEFEGMGSAIPSETPDPLDFGFPQSRARDVEYAPAGVLISYAAEDYDIAQAFFLGLQSLSETIYDRIKIFLDSKSIEGGDEIRADIKSTLRKSDFLVIIHTGIFKRSHGYTGWEVGFFEGLIEDELAKSGQTARRIIYLSFGETPFIGDGILSISLDIDEVDLDGTRAEYVQKSIRSTPGSDQLAGFFQTIANRAESRLPPPLREDRGEFERKRQRRRKQLAEDIIPNLRARLFDSMRTRPRRHSIEQRLVEFDLPKPASEQTYVRIPDDAKLIPHAGALEIFGISVAYDAITWGEFRSAVNSRDALAGSSILHAIEQAVISAISPVLRIDNDQIIESIDEQIFSLVVTQQTQYYDGRTIVQVYFIQKFQAGSPRDETSTVLGFINVATKYLAIFAHDSLLSVESFAREPDATKVQDKTRELIRQMFLIEGQARILKLEQIASVSVYLGGDQNHFEIAQLLQEKWIEARNNLMATGEKILGILPVSAEFRAVNEQWLTALKSFQQNCIEINSIMTVQALEKLKTTLARTLPASSGAM
jgi:hypothetical protein